jgi:hypothetical protein
MLFNAMSLFLGYNPVSNTVKNRKLEKAMNEEPDNFNTPMDGILKNAVLRFHRKTTNLKFNKKESSK